MFSLEFDCKLYGSAKGTEPGLSQECYSPYINTVNFVIKKDGLRTKITIDRDSTEWTYNDGALSMRWNNCYLWAINDCHLFVTEDENGTHYGLYNLDVEELRSLLDGAICYFELEDDAPEDYQVIVQRWSLCA